MRVPLQVLGPTVAKAWHDRILGLSAEAAFWQVLSVPPLLIGLLGSLGYLGNLIGRGRVTEIEDRLLTAPRPRSPPTSSTRLVRPTLNAILVSGRLDVVSVGLRAVAVGRVLGDGHVHQHRRHRLRPARRARADRAPG